MTTTENYGLKKPDGSDYASVGDINDNMDAIDKELKSQSAHADRMDNPHSVTKDQVGLGNVPNVATNDQTPTYSAASTLATLVSGEKLSVSMGKIMKAITEFISHKASTSNPHNVTKSQVGLGSVDNTADADKTVKSAGTCTGNAATATKLATARTIQTNLASTSAASFDGSANVTPGVTGTLPITNGGTGAATATKALENLGAAAVADLAKYLLLIGGTLTGDLAISTERLASLILHTPSVGSAFVQAGTNDLLLASATDSTWQNLRRIVVFNSAGRSSLKMAAQIHDVVDGTTTTYNLHGGHNKTTGTYTGNGSTTSRAIATGGIGNCVLITSSKGTAILSNGSGITFNSSVVASLLYSAAHFIDGTLTIASSSDFVNASGITYTYQVL